jgi:hypothetical protein
MVRHDSYIWLPAALLQSCKKEKVGRDSQDECRCVSKKRSPFRDDGLVVLAREWK